MWTKRTRTAIVALAVLAGCGAPDTRLPGERLGIRDFGSVYGPERVTEVNTARPIALPSARVNGAWTHRGGSAAHRITHPALPASLTLAFATDIGAGDVRRGRITADPVVAGSTIFAMDSRNTVSAVSNAGALLWQADLRRGFENPRDASGGGLAYAGGVVYVTTGFGELKALDAASGGTIWTQDLDASGGSAPTVSGDMIYVSARDSRGWAVDRRTGRVRWTLPGVPSPSGFGGGPGPAVADGLVVFPFSSGEVVGAFAIGGQQRWSSVVTGQRDGRALGTISEIAGDPVISGNVVYAANVSGRLEALSLSTGDRIWTADEGAVSPVVPVGGAVFLVNDLSQLVRLDAGTGQVIWRSQLPVREPRQGLFGGPSRSNEVYGHYGPVLAGGRLIVASSDGVLRQFDPRSGAVVGELAIPGGATTNPAVANGTLYVVSGAGQLLAFR